MDKKIQIGAVSYLNSKPLIEDLHKFAPNADILLDYPSSLADSLVQRQLDVALIPSIEFLRNPDYEMISDACVATHGAVMSVKLYSHVPPQEINELALDASSRTSSALVQVLLSERFGISPRTIPIPLGSTREPDSADAILLIGDHAMRETSTSYHTIWDLGEEWTCWTGLPFVFAVWAARRGTDLEDVTEALELARNCGIERLSSIAEREASLLDLSQQTILDYLTHNLHFKLGSAEQKGLNLFHKLAGENSLLANPPNQNL